MKGQAFPDLPPESNAKWRRKAAFEAATGE
jgi:hypothetical protein